LTKQTIKITLLLLQFILIGPAQKTHNPLLFAPNIISTSDSEFSITFSPDMQKAYFTRAVGKWGKEKLKSSIYFSEKLNGSWTKPKLASFSGKFNDSEPHITRDGKKLYFVSDRPTNSDNQSDDIWVTEKLPNSNWSEPVNLGQEINSGKTEFSPRTTANGDLYFASDREGGFGQGDLYVSRFINCKYTKPENLGKTINSPKGEWNLEISSDGSIIIFEASGREENMSPYGDLYISFRKKDKWTSPQNLKEINTTGSDLYPFLTQDRKYLYYTSTKSLESESANIYEIEFAYLMKKYLTKAKILPYKIRMSDFYNYF
jgi:hypothetical protein